MSKCLRRVVFSPRSALPASAACVVANGVRETLANLLGAPVEVALSEPAIPGAAAWPAILRGATIYRVVGAVTDAAIVLRGADALTLTAALFGEPAQAQLPRELSPLENDVLDRTVRALAAHLGAVCGHREAHAVERVRSLEHFSTYFEILIESPFEARIGIALSRDPQPSPQPRFEIGHLAEVPLRLRATMTLGVLKGAEAATLYSGALLPLGAAPLARCVLHAEDRPVMRGTCGVRNGHYAVTVTSL